MTTRKFLRLFFIFLIMLSTVPVMAQEDNLIKNATTSINKLKNQKEPNRGQYIANLRTIIIQSKSSRMDDRKKLTEMLYMDTNTDLKIVLLPEVISAYGSDKDQAIKSNLEKYIKEIKPELWAIVRSGQDSTVVCYSAATALDVIQEPGANAYLSVYSNKMDLESKKGEILSNAELYVKNINEATSQQIKDTNLEELKDLVKKSEKSQIQTKRQLLALLSTINDKDIKVRLIKKILIAYRNENDQQIQDNLKTYITGIKNELWVNAKGGANKEEKMYLAAYALRIINEPDAQKYIDQYQGSSTVFEDR